MCIFMNKFWKTRRFTLLDNYYSHIQGIHYCYISSHIELRATMRAWLFVLAVLATFKPIVQVASTDKRNKQQIDPVALEQFEKTLLNQLGIEKRPKIIDRSKIVIPDELKEVFNQMMTGHEDMYSVNLPIAGKHTKSANTIRSFAHEESKIDHRFRNHHRFRLFFNVSDIPKNEELKAAELTLSRKAITNYKRFKHNVLVYDIIKPGVKGKYEPIFLLIDTKTVHTDGISSVKLDVLPAVERWLKNPKENYGILVHVTAGKENKPAAHRHIRLKRSISDDEVDEWSQQQPFLFTYTDDGRNKQRSIRDVLASRSRRAPARRTHKRKDGREICQRRPLYVDFSSVGWSDWIVAPPGYEAYYCHGECQFPIADHLNSTNHAVVQTLVNSINREMAPKACCVPTQLKPISMLYLDDQNKVVLKNYQDMTVVGCGCR